MLSRWRVHPRDLAKLYAPDHQAKRNPTSLHIGLVVRTRCSLPMCLFRSSSTNVFSAPVRRVARPAAQNAAILALPLTGEPVVRHDCRTDEQTLELPFGVRDSVGRSIAHAAEPQDRHVGAGAPSGLVARGPDGRSALAFVVNPPTIDPVVKSFGQRAPARVIIKEHPTLAQISAREREILKFDQVTLSVKWIAGSLAPVGILLGASLWAIIPYYFDAVKDFALAIFLVGCAILIGAAFCIHIAIGEPTRGKRPTPLKLAPWERQENTWMLSQQKPDRFQAIAACPGCGHIEMHPFVERSAKPEWAAVVRRCGLCKREWAQA